MARGKRKKDKGELLFSILSEISLVRYFAKMYLDDKTKADNLPGYKEEFAEYERNLKKKRSEDIKKLTPKPAEHKQSSHTYKVEGGHVEGVDINLASFAKGYFSKAWVRRAVVSIAVFAVIYMAISIYLMLHSEVKIETVGTATYSESIETTGVAIRSEIPVSQGKNGTVVNAVFNGAKVSKGQAIVNIFDSAQAASAYTRAAEIDNEIEEFNLMANSSEDSAAEVTNLVRQMNDKLQTLLKNVDNGDFSNVDNAKSDLTYLCNKRLIAMRLVEDYQKRIDELAKERESLTASLTELPEKICAPASGYYIDNTDGYEDILNFSVLEELTPASLDKIMKKNVDSAKFDSGKLITDFKWYLACPVSSKDAEDLLKTESVYTLVLPYSETGSLKATLVSIKKDEETSDKALAIFECNSLVSELGSVRSQPVKIQIKSYSGFSIKKSALHVGIDIVSACDADGKPIKADDEKRYPCVYVLIGNQLFSRRVDIIYNGNKNVICSTRNSGSGYLQLYDQVVTEGKGLYEGKIINKK